jgi:hypothetical protein
MAIFPRASTLTIKGLLASWCKTLSGDAVLGVLKPEELGEDDMSILEGVFAGSAIRKLKKKRDKLTDAH